MIHLTRLNRLPLIVNSDLIEHIETAPDTVIALTTGQRFMVLETAAEVVDRIVAFRRLVYEGWGRCPLARQDAEALAARKCIEKSYGDD